MSTISLHARSDVGQKRDNNEDNFYTHRFNDQQALFLVADGVGGRAYGEVASQTIVDVLSDLAESGKLVPLSNSAMTKMLLTMAVQKAHVSIANKGQDESEYNGMSSTLSLVYVNEASVWLAQVGDSRLYLYSKDQLEQLSVDQTIGQALLESGQITEERLATHPDRNVLQQSMGLEAVGQPLEPVVTEHTWQNGDVLLVCSDGLSDMLSDDEIQGILQKHFEPEQALTELIGAANEAGGKDNITVVLAVNNLQNQDNQSSEEGVA